MEKTTKPGILAQAFKNAAAEFEQDKDALGYVSANEVGAVGVALACAALLYTVVAGKSLIDVAAAGVLAALALSGVALMKYLSKPGGNNVD